MTRLNPLRFNPKKMGYKSGDVLVLFGELFNRGYGNGIVEEAEAHGLKVIRATVGRRDKDGELRALTAEELAAQQGVVINVPLEAGFDLEKASDGLTPVDRIKDVKLSSWQQVTLDFAKIHESRDKGAARFVKNVRSYMQELAPHIPAGANVCFVHLMAGGVPRAKILMPLMNRVFKGTGDRHLASEQFWNSPLGQLTSESFNSVTADTFRHLIEESASLRSSIEQKGGSVRYLAYGYHGTEVLIQNQYLWQTYTSYLQGYAKIRLEKIAEEFWQKGIRCSVFNCPEILTNSSSIFQGVEVSLYPLIGALQKEGPSAENVKKILKTCEGLLKEGTSLQDMLKFTDQYLASDIIREHCDFTKWPQHSSKEQMEKMLLSSDALISMHTDEKQLITFPLSEAVFLACGALMLLESFKLEAPVYWIGHDVISKYWATTPRVWQ